MPGIEATQPAAGELIPPLPLCAVVGSRTHRSFTAVGKESLHILRQHGGLKPTDDVLEAGCGCGRVAIPLTGYLTSGSYEGFDVVPELVQWTRESITPRHPGFRFTHVDLYNDFYNPAGRVEARDFVFPYDAGAFDFILLVSVFTHLLHADVRRYLAEMHRTLRPDGKALMSFFILNAESERLVESGSSQLAFPHRRFRGLRVEDAARPAGAVAYPENLVRSLLAASGFVIQEPILYGSWCGRKDTVSFQDYVVVRKAAAALRKPALWRRLLNLRRMF